MGVAGGGAVQIAGKPVPHESACGHVTGEALYTDDLVVRFPRLLHAWPVTAPHAHALVKAMDPTPGLNVPGVVTILTGADVRELVRGHCEGTGFPGLEWSGLSVEAEPAGERLRLVAVTVGGEPLDDARTYRVATNSFLAGGGDGFGPFERGRNMARTSVLLREALAKDLKERSPLTPPAEERLRVNVPARGGG